MAHNPNHLRIATLSASVGGGYADHLKVFLDTESGRIFLEVTTSHPRGGMDGDPTLSYYVAETKSLPGDVTPPVLLKAVKSIIANKNKHMFSDKAAKCAPTKNIRWTCADPDGDGYTHGLNLKNCANALRAVRLQSSK